MSGKSSTTKDQKKESQSAQTVVADKTRSSGVEFEDNRPETQVQFKVKEGLDSKALKAPPISRLSAFTIQPKAISPLQQSNSGAIPLGGIVQLNVEEPGLQAPVPISSETAQFAGAGESNPPPASGNSSNSGLPTNLKSGVEKLSGQSMSDVTVHPNSDKPAQLNAHAYARGSEIHLAPGQEKHLPHEAWHVVQQKQGRVQPTRQLKGKVPVNDDEGLEHEADVMGAQALEVGQETVQAHTNQPLSAIGNTAQLVEGDDVGADVAEVLDAPTETATMTPEAETAESAGGQVDRQVIEEESATQEDSGPEIRTDTDSGTPADDRSINRKAITDPQSIEGKIKGALGPPTPPKFAKRAFIITPFNGLRNLDVSKKLYAGLKAKESLTKEATLKAGSEGAAPALSGGMTQGTGTPTALEKNSLGSSWWSAISKPNEETADQAMKNILDKGENKELPQGSGFVDTFKKVFGVGKKTSLTLAPALDPKKEKFPTGIPVYVDENDKISGYVAVKFDFDGIKKFQEDKGNSQVGTKSEGPGFVDKFKNIFGVGQKTAPKASTPLDALIKKTNPTGVGYIPFNRLAVTTINLNNNSRIRIGSKPSPASSARINYPPLEDGKMDGEKRQGEDTRVYKWAQEDKSWTNDAGDGFIRDKNGSWIKKEKSFSTRAGEAIVRGGKKAVSKLSGINAVANWVNSKVDAATESMTKAEESKDSTDEASQASSGKLQKYINMAREKAKEVPVLNKLGLKILPGGTRLIPGQGLFASFRASYNFGDEVPNDLAITPNLMVNIKDGDDWFVEYLGATLEVPKFSLGSDDAVKVNVDLGTLSHEPTDGGSIFGVENGTIDATFLDQKVGVKIKKATFDTAATSEKFKLEIGELSANLKILSTQVNIKIVEPSFKDGKLNFTSAEGEIPSVTPFEGVNFSDVHVKMTKAEEGNTVAGTANFNVTNEYIKAASGKLGIYKNGKNKADFILSDGNVVAGIFDQNLSLSGITYDSSKEPKIIKLTQGKLALNLNNPIQQEEISGEAVVSNAKLSANSFTFDQASASFGDISITDGAVFKGTQATLIKEEAGYRFAGSSRFEASGAGYFQSAAGLLSIHSTPQKEGKANALYSLTGGSIIGNIVGFDFNITGISLDSDTKTLAADWAGIEVDPFGDGDKIDLGITEITVNKNGFNFGSAEVKLPDYHVTDDWKLTQIHGGIRKKDDGRNWEYFASASLGNSVGADLGNGVIIESAAGTFEIVKQKGEPVPSFNLLDGQLKADISGSNLNIEKLAFLGNKLQVTKASLELVMPELTSGKPKATVENMVIGDDGIQSMKGNLDLSSLGKIDQGPLSVEPESIDVVYNDESFLLSATGSAKLVNVLPVIPDVGVAGTFGYDFKKRSSAFEVDSAGISFSVPSPLAGVKLPDHLPGVNGIWPLSIGLSVPIVPGVSVDLGLEVGGGVSFGDTIQLGAQVDRKLLTLSATMSVNPALHIAIVASATAGIGVIGLTAGLKGLAGLRFEGPDHLKLRLAKTFVIGKGSVPRANEKITPENISKSKSEKDGFTTSGKGEIVGALQAFVRGYALTFKKEYSKTLAEASVGSFEITNDGFTFKRPEKPLDADGVKQTAAEAKEQEARLKAERKAEKERIDLGYSKLTQQEILHNISGGKRLTDEQLKFTVRELDSKDRRESSTTAEDLNWIAEINYERIDWERLSDLEPIEKWPAGEPKVQKIPKENRMFFKSKYEDTEKWARYKERVQPTAKQVTDRNVKILAQSIHTKNSLATAYENQIKRAAAENHEDIKPTLVYHNELLLGYRKINVLKKNELRAPLLSGARAENMSTIYNTWLGSIEENEKFIQSFSDLAATLPPLYQELNSKKQMVFKERAPSTIHDTGAAAAAEAAENEEAAQQKRFEEEQQAAGLEQYKGEWMTASEKAAALEEEALTATERQALDEAVQAAEGKTGEEKETADNAIKERKSALEAKLTAEKAKAAAQKATVKAEAKKVKQAERLAERNKYAEMRRTEAIKERNNALAAAQAARASKGAKAIKEEEPTPLAAVD